MDRFSRIFLFYLFVLPIIQSANLPNYHESSMNEFVSKRLSGKTFNSIVKLIDSKIISGSSFSDQNSVNQS